MSAYDLERRLESLRFATMLVLLGSCFLFGGASRVDVLSLLVLQPLAVICLGVFLFTSQSLRWSSIRVPTLLLAALASIMAVQLIPLAPQIWLSLPGHGAFGASAAAAGLEQPWRPISLTPDLTLASLVSLSVPAAVLIGFASLSIEHTRGLLSCLLIAATASAVIGLAQIATGGGGPLYLYEITNLGSPVGLFSNRNHQAVLLAMGWPILALWASLPADPKRVAAKRWTAVALAIFLLPMIMATGSRAGLALGAAGLCAAPFLWRAERADGSTMGRLSRFLGPTALLAALTVIGATIVLSRDEAVQRAIGVDLSDESRLQYLPILLRIAGDFFPVGSGFGSFDPLFRAYEPPELLQPTYFNHAHNDLLETAIVGGLPAMVVLILFFVWFIRRSVPLVRGMKGRQPVDFGRLGAILIVMLLLSSIVDYPLRTPVMAAIFALACGWIGDATVRGRAAAKELYERPVRP